MEGVELTLVNQNSPKNESKKCKHGVMEQRGCKRYVFTEEIPSTTIANGAFFRNCPPMSFASESFSIRSLSSTTTNCHERLPLDVGDIRAARRMVFTSSASIISCVKVL